MCHSFKICKRGKCARLEEGEFMRSYVILANLQRYWQEHLLPYISCCMTWNRYKKREREWLNALYEGVVAITTFARYKCMALRIVSEGIVVLYCTECTHI